ncbi:S41 family peptidase [Paenibacillaceae bacterium WGS1546]|uniref:S41 family peptidase n=1 Tax=Cohnella sp. WGS1546 TaxID=3366810 RepID=UPI00372D1C4A
MWFRGRTVLAMMVLTTIAACVATYMYLEYPNWSFSPSSAKAGEGSPDGKGLRQDELDKLNKAVELIEGRFMLPTDRGRLMDGAIQGMVESLGDPYSLYKSESESEAYSDSLQGAFTGIGARLMTENGTIAVESLVRRSPAERAGLQPGDLLLSVNGESLYGFTVSEAVEKIRGPKGTKAKLKVQRKGVSAPLDLELVRDRIDPESVVGQMGDGGVGLLTISQFADDTAIQVSEVLEDMRKQGLRALVIDVRDNPGGYFQAVVDVADQLVEKGKPIVQSEYRNGDRKIDEAVNGIADGEGCPIVVLVNKGTASSAEILAGALKQSGGAVLVGETTYGKGTVQVPFNEELGDRSLIKLTVYKWLLPDGTWINDIGLEPDIRVVQPSYYRAWRLPRDSALKYDDAGEAVQNLHTILAGIGFPADRSDGYFGHGTARAVKDFQESESLPATGEVDAETAQRMEEKLYERISDPNNDAQLKAARAKARELSGS